MSKPKGKAAGVATKGLSVISKRASFYRGGMEFGSDARIVPLSDLTEAQAEQIRAEPMLVVTEVDIAPVAPAET